MQDFYLYCAVLIVLLLIVNSFTSEKGFADANIPS